jgi:hypothetical protein
VKNLVNAAARVASALQITRLDINNDVRRIRSKSEAAMIVQREVSPSESFALLEPSTTMTTTMTACAASDTLSSMTGCHPSWSSFLRYCNVSKKNKGFKILVVLPLKTEAKLNCTPPFLLLLTTPLCMVVCQPPLVFVGEH